MIPFGLVLSSHLVRSSGRFRQTTAKREPSVRVNSRGMIRPQIGAAGAMAVGRIDDWMPLLDCPVNDCVGVSDCPVEDGLHARLAKAIDHITCQSSELSCILFLGPQPNAARVPSQPVCRDPIIPIIRTIKQSKSQVSATNPGKGLLQGPPFVA